MNHRGVRSFVNEDGMRSYESVGIYPGGGLLINPAARSDAYKTKEEAAQDIINPKAPRSETPVVAAELGSAQDSDHGN